MGAPEKAPKPLAGARWAALEAVEHRPAHRNDIMRAIRQGGESRHRACNRTFRTLGELEELGFVSRQGSMYDATNLGLAILAQEREKFRSAIHASPQSPRPSTEPGA